MLFSGWAMKQYLQSVMQKVCNVLKYYIYAWPLINHTVFEMFCLTVVDKCKTVHFVV